MASYLPTDDSKLVVLVLQVVSALLMSAYEQLRNQLLAYACMWLLGVACAARGYGDTDTEAGRGKGRLGVHSDGT